MCWIYCYCWGWDGTHIFVVSMWNAFKNSFGWWEGGLEFKPLGALAIALRCFVWRRD